MNNKLDITYVNDKTNIQNVSGYGTQMNYHRFKPTGKLIKFNSQGLQSGLVMFRV